MSNGNENVNGYGDGDGNMVKAIALRFSLDKFIFGICVTVHTDNQFNSTMQLNQLKTINLYYSNVYLAMPTMTYCACTLYKHPSSKLNGPDNTFIFAKSKLFQMQLAFSNTHTDIYTRTYAHTRTLPHVDIVNNSITIRWNKHKLRQSCRKCCSTKLISPSFFIR